MKNVLIRVLKPLAALSYMVGALSLLLAFVLAAATPSASYAQREETPTPGPTNTPSGRQTSTPTNTPLPATATPTNTAIPPTATSTTEPQATATEPGPTSTSAAPTATDAATQPATGDPGDPGDTALIPVTGVDLSAQRGLASQGFLNLGLVFLGIGLATHGLWLKVGKEE